MSTRCAARTPRPVRSRKRLPVPRPRCPRPQVHRRASRRDDRRRAGWRRGEMQARSIWPRPSTAAETEGSCGATTAFDGAALVAPGGVDRVAAGRRRRIRHDRNGWPEPRARTHHAGRPRVRRRRPVLSRTASSRGPSTTWRGTTVSSGPSARLTTTSCPTPGSALRQRRLPGGRVPARPRRGHRRARGLRQPHACAVRRERGQRPKPPRRPGRCDSGRGEPRPGVQPARRRGEPRQVRGSRRARTSLARGAGLLRAQQLGGRGRPDPSRRGREPARVEPAGPEPRCSTCAPGRLPLCHRTSPPAASW